MSPEGERSVRHISTNILPQNGEGVQEDAENTIFPSEGGRTQESLKALAEVAREEGKILDARLAQHRKKVLEIEKSVTRDHKSDTPRVVTTDGFVPETARVNEMLEEHREGDPMTGAPAPMLGDTSMILKGAFLQKSHTDAEIENAVKDILVQEKKNSILKEGSTTSLRTGLPQDFSIKEPGEPTPILMKRDMNDIPVLRSRYIGSPGIDIPPPGTYIDTGDGKQWKVHATTGESVQLVAEDGTNERDVPLAEFAAARLRAEEEERRVMEETRIELERMEDSRRFSVGATLERVRFDVARGVAETASYAFGGISTVFAGKPTGRFLNALSLAYEARAQEETKKLSELEKVRAAGTNAGARYQDIANATSIAGNVMKYGRVLADIAGQTAAAPLRWVTIGAMAAQEVADVTKEARFSYDEVKEKTRVRDIERAQEEAIALTERALKNKGLTLEDLKNGKSVSAEELQEAYREGLPKDLLERLVREPMPGTGRGIVERMYRTYIGWRAEGIQKKIDDIDTSPGDEKEKAARKRELLLRFGRSKALNDFDRMLGEQGTIDRIAMSADMGSLISKTVIYGTMAQSIYLVFDRIAEAFSEHGTDIVPTGPTSDLVDKESVDSAVASMNVVETDHQFSSNAHHLWSTAEHAGTDMERVPLPEYAVEFGDSTYKMLRERVPSFRDLGEGQAREYAMAKFLSSLSPEQIRTAGFSSGTTQVVYPGERINLEYLEHLAQRETKDGGSIIEQALRRYGASEPTVVTESIPKDVRIEEPKIHQIFELTTESKEAERLAVEAVREEKLFRYIDAVILADDFHGDREQWNRFAVGSARRFFEASHTSTEGVLLQKRLLSLAQISETAPLSFESVHEFVDRAFRDFIERSGVEPKSEESIGEYLERATESYLRTHSNILGKGGIP